MSKSTKTTAAKSATRTGESKIGKNDPIDLANVPKVTEQDLALTFGEEVKAEHASKAAQTLTVKRAVAFAIRNRERVALWNDKYLEYAPVAGITGETRPKSLAAAKWFATEVFKIGDEPVVANGGDKEPLNVWRAKRTKVLKIANFTTALYRGAHLSAFHFNKSGGAYIDRNSPLGMSIWTFNEWNDNAALMEQEPERIAIVDRTSQRLPGMVAWVDLITLLVGRKRDVADTGTAAEAQRKTYSDANPSGGLASVVSLYVAHPPKDDDMTAKRMALKDCESILQVHLAKSPIKEIRELWTEHFENAFKVARTVLGVSDTGSKPQAQAVKGVDTVVAFERKGDLKSPESAKTLPHPSNPANNAPAPVTDKPKSARKVANDK